VTNVIAHHILNKECGEEDTYDGINEVKPVGLRRVKTMGEQSFYFVNKPLQCLCRKSRTDTHEKAENKNELPLREVLITPYS
jgi:hypothetical protein